MVKPLKNTGNHTTKRPKPGDVDRIRVAASIGANMAGVAASAGISRWTLTEWFERHLEVKAAYDEGKEQERATLHNKLFEMALNGNVVAGIFLLKARHGYREGELVDAGNRVSINFQLPGAQPLEKFMGVLDGQRQIADTEPE